MGIFPIRRRRGMAMLHGESSDEAWRSARGPIAIPCVPSQVFSRAQISSHLSDIPPAIRNSNPTCRGASRDNQSLKRVSQEKMSRMKKIIFVLQRQSPITRKLMQQPVRTQATGPVWLPVIRPVMPTVIQPARSPVGSGPVRVKLSQSDQ